MRQWMVRLLSVGRRGARDRELDDELRFHVEQLAADYQRRGMSPAEARVAANRELGGVDRARQAWRDQRTWLPAEEFLHDARHAWRLLRRSPGSFVGAATILALAVSASVSVFAVVDAVLLAPLPYANPGRLVQVYERFMSARSSDASVAPGTFVEWTERARAFTALTAVDTRQINLTSGGEPRQVTAGAVSSGFAATVGIVPALGRSFADADFNPGSDSVVLLSHGLWRSRFGGKPNIVGMTMTADDRVLTVVGVMPERFLFPGPEIEAWIPMPVTAAIRANRGSHSLEVFARVRDGVAIDVAERDLQAVAGDLRREFPDSNAEWDVLLRPMRRALLGDTRVVLAAILGAVGFLLAVACANAAGLLLTSGLGRERELAIRSALGANRARVIRQMLTESLVLSSVAALAGVAIAWLVQPLLETLRPVDFLAWKPIAIDSRAALFAALAALVSGVAAGTLPAVLASRVRIAAVASQRSPGRGASRARFALVALEVGLSVLLAVAAVNLVRTLVRLTSVETGVDAEGVVTVSVSLPETRYADGARVTAFHQAALERMRQIAGVRAAGATVVMPFSGNTFVRPFAVTGLPVNSTRPEIAHYRIVTPGYFESMGIRLRAGRAFTSDDRADRPLSVIVNQAMRREVWGDANPLDASITFAGSATLIATVVGVVDDVRHFGPSAPAPIEMYWPAAQIDVAKSAALDRLRRNMTFVVKTGGDPLTVVPALRAAVRELDVDQPIAHVQTLASMLDRALWLSRASAWIVSLIGVSATLFALLGVFASASFAVSQRKREVAVRLALGAPPAVVSRGVVSNVLAAAALGAAMGSILAWPIARAIASQVPSIEPVDAWLTSSIGATMLIAAALSCWKPARRASRIDPIEALRVDG
jgi:putative ABC transport system permease protein